MAVEDGKILGSDRAIIEKLIASRRETFPKMMKRLEGMDYEIVDLREEAGFMSRLAIKKTYEGAPRGMVMLRRIFRSLEKTGHGDNAEQASHSGNRLF